MAKVHMVIRPGELKKTSYTVDSHYLEFVGTMEKIRVHRSSTQEELRKYWKWFV